MSTPAPAPRRPARLALLGAAPVVSALLLGACSNGTVDDAATAAPTVAGSPATGSTAAGSTAPDGPSQDSTATGGPAPGGAVTASADATSGAAGPSTAAPAAGGTDAVPPADGAGEDVVAPETRSTAARSSPPPATVTTLVGVATDETADAETIRFATAGGVPGFQVSYVDAVRVEGEPVLVEGEAFLEVVLESADPDAQEGLSPDVAVELLVAQDLVREVRFARYVDGVVTYAVGLSEAAEYTVAQDDAGLTLTFPR